jgi:DNA (cytosine-5)-methyltransferase 1
MRARNEHTFERLAVADLFCGAGGMSDGFRKARVDGHTGFEVVFGVDRDPDAIATFRNNVLRGNVARRERRGLCQSVETLTGQAILDAAGVDNIDVLIGGPNCQAVSSAGRRIVDDARNTMFEHFVRLVEELRPRWFVMENVPGLTHATSLPILGEVFAKFGALSDYRVAGDVLLAADFGVPQYRYRLFIVGTRTELPLQLPMPTHSADGFPRYRTVRQALGGPSKQPRIHKPEAELDLNERRIRHVPQGGDWRDIPIDLLPDRSFAVRTSDQKGAYGRLSWSRPSFTITSLANNVTAGPFAHPTEDRSLTVAEAAILQGFRRTNRFAGAASSQLRQIGNAVPPRLARAVAEAILRVEAGYVEGLSDPRLTPVVVKDAVGGKSRLPVMTPRISSRRATPPVGRPTSPGLAGATPSIVPVRIEQAADMVRLHAESALPRYSWTAKRAKSILGGLAGQDFESLGTELKIAPYAARRWYEEFVQAGPEGWRAYHTPVERILSGDAEAAARVAKAVERVRRPALDAQVQTGRARAHMNPYLRDLISRFGSRSINQMKDELRAAGLPIGTMYVGDMLALAGVVLSTESSTSMNGRNAAAAAPE